MGISYVTLKVSEEITNGTDVADEYTPANGAEVWVENFHANAAFTTNSACLLIWDYGGTEEVVWSTKGTDVMNEPVEITGANGTKKLAVVCSNGEAGNLIMSVMAKIKVKT